MKLLSVALLAVAALSVSGAAATTGTPCCNVAPSADFDPQWSSDGSRIAFIRHDPSGFSALYTMAADGGEARRVGSIGRDFQPNSPWQRPSLSPDWTSLALIAPTTALKIESVDRSQIHEVGIRVQSFAWSPDGQHIAYHQLYDSGAAKIFVVDRDGNHLEDLGPGRSPTWSPDGDRIAFAGNSDGKLYVMNADGSDRRLLYDDHGAIAAPSWSPRGDRLAFYSARGITVIAAGGARVEEIITTEFDSLNRPHWSFDETFLAVETGNAYAVYRLGTADHWLFENHRDPAWSPVANDLVLRFAGPCQRDGIYRMSVPSAGRRLTLDCHIRGTDGPDDLTGTPFTDIISGLAGDDELLGGGGEDRLMGGTGDDTLLGGQLADRLEGGYGADLLVGGSFPPDPMREVDDTLIGGPGPDDLRGGPGRDALHGGAGNDVLRGGPDEDFLFSGPGNDRIYASGDGRDASGSPMRDIVSCGGGRHDVAFVDRQDYVSGCETVHRR